MKRIITLLIISLTMGISCKKSFLDYTPTGKVTDAQLNTPTNAEKMCTAAYASLGNDDWTVPFVHMWPWGSVRGGDAYKGGGSVGDQGQFDQMEKFNLVIPTTGSIDAIWSALYEGIGRANDAMQRINKFSADEFPNKSVRLSEMRFIRGHFHFLLKILFKNIPYIDETVAQDNRGKIANNALTNTQLWDKIADDFQAGVDSLPVTQPEIGRANKIAAYAYLAKVRLFETYEQDINHQVTTINAA